VNATAAEWRAAGPLVSAGVLAGVLARLADAVAALEGAEILHIDVGDGVYSPLMIGGPGLVAAVRTSEYKDVHLMIVEPQRHVAAFAQAGSDAITIQLDCGRHVVACLREIGAHASARHPDRPILRGVALPVEAPVGALEPLLGELDLVLVLGVVPGYRGPAIRGLAERVAAVRELAGPDVLVSVDGGITAELAPTMRGADVIVSGSALFAAGDPAAALRAFQVPGARHSGGSSAVAGSIAS
jgi:ribulose-phosphate 3-epimerase